MYLRLELALFIKIVFKQKTNYLLHWHFVSRTDFFQSFLDIFFSALDIGKHIRQNFSLANTSDKASKL